MFYVLKGLFTEGKEPLRYLLDKNYFCTNRGENFGGSKDVSGAGT